MKSLFLELDFRSNLRRSKLILTLFLTDPLSCEYGSAPLMCVGTVCVGTVEVLLDLGYTIRLCRNTVEAHVLYLF